MLSLAIFVFFAHKWTNMSKIENYCKFWIFVDFALILMDLWAKLIFGHFSSIVMVNIQIVAKIRQQIQIPRTAYTSFDGIWCTLPSNLLRFAFFHFWMLPNWRLCIQSRQVLGNRQTAHILIKLLEEITFRLWSAKLISKMPRIWLIFQKTFFFQ